MNDSTPPYTCQVVAQHDLPLTNPTLHMTRGSTTWSTINQTQSCMIWDPSIWSTTQQPHDMTLINVIYHSPAPPYKLHEDYQPDLLLINPISTIDMMLTNLIYHALTHMYMTWGPLSWSTPHEPPIYTWHEAHQSDLPFTNPIPTTDMMLINLIYHSPSPPTHNISLIKQIYHLTQSNSTHFCSANILIIDAVAPSLLVVYL